MLFALAGFATPTTIDRSLRASLDGRLAPAVDRATLLIQMLSSRPTAAPTWDHLRSEWPRLEAAMPPILLAPARLVPRIFPFVRRFRRPRVLTRLPCRVKTNVIPSTHGVLIRLIMISELV